MLARSAPIDRLGAPIKADWTPYPVPDKLLFNFAGLLAKGVGLIAAIQLTSALIFGLNAVSFYLCGRWLRWRPEWAASLALIFAFCSYNVRWGITLSLSQTFLLPPLVLICARAARHAPWSGLRFNWWLLAAMLGIWFGGANPYLTFFAIVVAGGTLILSLWRRCPLDRLLPLLFLFAFLFLSFAASNAGHVRTWLHEEHGAALVRTAHGTHTYALRLADWIVPPADHRIPYFSSIGSAYQTALKHSGEFFYNYLGLFGMAGLIGLLGKSLVSAYRFRWRSLDPLWGLTWIIAFGISGGINTWLGSAGLDLFRAGSRIGIYAMIWASFCLGGILSRKARQQPRILSVSLALLVALVALWEQTPPLAERSMPKRHHAFWKDMETLTRSLEQILPPGAKIFQLPATPFPEAGTRGAMGDYQHFLPFLTSSSLHFSYGQLHASPWLHWASYVASQDPGPMISTLERTGFSAIWIDSRAYADNATALAAALHSSGAIEFPVPAALSHLKVFRLRPQVPPQLPDPNAHHFLEPWNAEERATGLYAVSGWYPLELQGNRNWRWAAHRAMTGYWHENTNSQASLRFKLTGPRSAVIIIRHGETEIWRGQPSQDEVVMALHLVNGLNTLHWELKGRTFRPKDDPRELGFMVENLSLSVP